MPTSGEEERTKVPQAIEPMEESEPRPTFVTPAPLPLNVPEMFTPLAPFVTTLGGSCAAVSVPVMFAAATELALPAVAAFAARTAYGVAVSGCLGLRVANAPPPFVRTPISSQRSAPGN